MLNPMKPASWMVAVVLALGACGKSADGPASEPPKMETPKASATWLAKAINDRKAAAGLALLPSDDAVRKALDCPGDEIVKRLTEQRAKAPKDFEKLPPDTTVALGAFDKEGTEEKILKPGETYEGCKTKIMVTVHKARLELQFTKGGKTDYDGETWTFLKFGEEEKWYFVD
jgi:hypothetical protein